MSAMTQDQRQGDVIDLWSRRGLDLRALTCGQIASARAKLGITTEEFAARLSDMLDWQPTPDVVEQWESTIVPPGDVLLAAAIAVQESSLRRKEKPTKTAGVTCIRAGTKSATTLQRTF